MFGLGVIKGLGVTIKHFVETFVDDMKYFPNSALNKQAFESRQSPQGRGLYTVQYPEIKLTPPENFRFMPFLITDYETPQDSPDFNHEAWVEGTRCTACGICAKVCPPQCIWIVRSSDPETGKPVSKSAEFYIDTDICMNCGYCAEFCPFDAIKMDHDFELSDYAREEHVHDLKRLVKPTSYYDSIRPTWNAKEIAAREAAEEEKRRKEEEKKRKQAEKAKAAAEAKAKAAATEAAKPAEAKAAGTDKPKRSPEEIKAQREAMQAKRRAAKEGGAAEATPAAESAAPEAAAKPAEKPKRTPEEIKAQREAMQAKRRAAKNKDNSESK